MKKQKKHFQEGTTIRQQQTARKEDKTQINEGIRAKEVRLIAEDGEQLGIKPIREALYIATEKNLDLVNISPNAAPPVCKIMDYGKHKFEQEKKEKEMRKNQKTVTVKEIRMEPGIADHDFQTKLRNVLKFLNEGDKVQVSVRFRGRAITHPELGRELLKRTIEACKEVGSAEGQPKLEGKLMMVMLKPAN